jgi:hypothetical protein
MQGTAAQAKPRHLTVLSNCAEATLYPVRVARQEREAANTYLIDRFKEALRLPVHCLFPTQWKQRCRSHYWATATVMWR